MLVGAYLGAGLSPKMVSVVDKHSITESTDDLTDAKLDVMHVSHKGALKRWGRVCELCCHAVPHGCGDGSHPHRGSCPCPRAWSCWHSSCTHDLPGIIVSTTWPLWSLAWTLYVHSIEPHLPASG